MEELENLFKKINKIKDAFHFSLDLNYNDLDDTFVVRISNIHVERTKQLVHFRNKKIIDSMLDAYNYLRFLEIKEFKSK